MRILVVDDEKLFRVSLCDDLDEAGFETYGLGSAEEVMEELKKNVYDVVLTDLRLPRMDGIALLKKIKKSSPDIIVIVMTAYATVQTAVEAIKQGAYDYITKPFTSEELFLTLKRLAKYQSILKENINLKKQLESQYEYKNLIGKSKVMRDIFHLIKIVSSSDSSILISGGTGTGKEMIADAIHFNGARKKGPYIKVSCATISKDILESELFGHVKGAFTGAIREKKGRFELADKGTILLDDVDDIPIELQVKLLRVLEEHSFEKVGGTKKIKVDIRVIAATKVDLQKMVNEGKFRADLFYRLNVVPIYVPPLRERREDIHILIEHFIKIYSRDKPLRFAPSVIKRLIDYSWPGNVRELRNIIERLALISEGEVITENLLPDELLGSPQPLVNSLSENEPLNEILEKTEIIILKNALSKTNGNQSQTAKLLEIPLSTLRSKLQKYGLI
ncbi:MAG: sigma-54-dependent Fis family transcriptional regulator [Candidatus Marinimicrobia bacterium]|nr:sigma-54-dependent Fis family transcriptional regulator [Candidatus Neomarinimicrobiota bacterium]